MSSQHHILHFEPAVLSFRDVKLNQAYNASLCISNPMTAGVDFTLRASSARYTVVPNRVFLNAGQSIYVSVKLLLNHYPNISRGKAGIEDYIHVKSTYFDQRIPLEFSLVTSMSERRSRSASPSRAGSSSFPTSTVNNHTPDQGHDMLLDLKAQVTAKDRRIEELELLVGKLETKHPNLQEIIHSRLEMERIVFEEKSEKILQILRKKDDAIEELQNQIEQQDRALASHRANRRAEEEKQFDDTMSRDYWSGRPKSSPLTAQSSAESEQLKKENEKLKNSLKKKQFETESLQKELKHIEELHSRDGFTGSDRMQSMVKELRALREKTVDQAEQIETLVAELSGIRRETSDVDRKVEYSEAEVHKLKTERQQLFHRVKDLEQKMSNLHKEHERTLKQLSKAAAEKSSVSHKTRDENIDNSNSSSDVRYEDQVGGGIATATPRHFRTRLPDDTEKLTDQTANLRLYKDMAEEYEHKNEVLSRQIKDSINIENSLKEKIKENEAMCEQMERDKRELLSQNDELKRELARPEASDISFDSSRRGSNAYVKKSAEHRAEELLEGHQWWCYIWHELRKQYKLDNDKRRIATAGDYDFETEDQNELHFQINKLKENLRAQAIEISSLRQENLGHKLTLKRELATMKNRIENNEREKSHLQTLLRTTKADKEIKIAEMAGTIKSLMVRGDMYSQLAACRQELEAERLTVFHLRAEMDSYRNLLEQEQRKCSSLTKEMSTLQGKLDGNELAQTLFNIPGVNPATVLEVMSSEFVQVRTELSKAQSNLLESTEQVKTLQRLLESQTEKLSIATKSSQNMNPSPDTKRSKSQFKRTTWSTDQENFPPLNNTMESDFMASPESSPTSPQLFNVVIEGDTSPRTLLQAYEISTLLNKIASQESMIKKLQQEAEEAHASTLHRMKVGDMELVDKSERLEWENSVKLMELANVRIDELKKEVDLLKDEKADLEKKLCDFNTSTHGKISSTTKWKLEDDLPLLTSNDSIATTVKEIEDLKNELKEKSMKIKILTSSLESLQYAGVGEMQHDFNAQNAMDLLNSSNSRNLEQLAAMSLPNENHSVWAKQALVKRIVDLTSELSAKAVEANREKQRSDELENKYRQSMRELSKAHAILSASESEKSSLQKTEEILTKQVQDFERQLIDCQMSLKKENDQLVTALREAECDANEFILKIDELSLQLKHTERKDILQFMDSVLAAARVVESNDDQVLSQPTWSGENVGNSAPEPGLKQMIQTLLTEWRESVGVIPPKISSFASQTLPKLSKGEQQFYQKVTDMVTKAHQKVVDITATNVTIEHKMKLKQKENENLKYQLEICAQQLTSLKRRNFAYERAVRSNHKHLAAKNGRVVSVLRKALTEERSRYSQVSSDLRTERKQRLLLNIERVVEASDKRRLQSQLAALEAKGSSFLRGKEDATNSMKDKLRELESDFFNWTKIELPRLVSGLPVTEDAIAGLTYGHTNSMPDQTVGSERTYALSQALCASKVTQATLDMKILELSEKLGIERDKNIALEGVLIKWRDQIEKTISGEDHDGQRIDVDYAQRLVFTSMEKEQTMIDSMSRLNLQVTELEEEIVEYRARLEHAESQAKQAKSMLEASYEQDETTKSKAIQQLTKIRIDLENEHAKELKSLREAYEAERRQLMDELRSVAEAVEEAKITAPHVSRWPAIPDEKSFDYNSAPADIPWYQPKRSNVDGQPDNTSEATGSRESAAGFAKIDKAKGGKPSEGLLSKQIRSQKVHNLDERSKEDKEIGISMLDSYSDSGSVAEALNAMANISNSSASNGSIRDVQIENMVRMVELEKRKSAEARLEVKELEELLAIQQRYIKDTVGNLKRKEEELNSREAELSNQQQKVTQSHADEKAVKHLAEAVEEEVRKEDRSLWPSVGNLAEELIGLLQSITLRFSPSDLENDLLRSALSMACRLKEACATAQFHAKFESFLTGREPAVFEQTDKLSFNPGGVEMSESMQTLANRVKLIESDLAERNVPERYLYLLRDLRIRVSELEQTFTMQLEKERERWAVERATLLKKDSETTAYANQILREKEDSVQTIKMRYEEALKKAEDTLEANTSAAKREIERLEELVKSLSNHLANEQQEKASIAEISRNSSTGKSSAEEFFKMQKLLDHTSDELERSRQEVHHIHNQYSKDIDDLKHNFTKFRQAHDQLVKNLEEQLEESQLRENYSTSLSEDPSMLSGFMLSSSAAPKKSKIEVEERLRKLEYKYKSKCGELDAVLRALSKTGESGAVDSTNSSIVTNTVATEAKKDTKTNFNVPSRSQEHVKPNQGTTVSTSNKESELARDIQQQINEARIVASEKEIETLQKALLQEKQQNATLNMHIQQLQVRVQQEMSEKEEAIKASNSAMTNFAPGLNPSFNAFFPTDSSSKAQIQQHEVSQGVDESNMKAQSTQIEFKPLHASENSAFLKEFVKDFTLPFPLSENEQVKVLLRRVNNMKKVAKIEIGELYDKVNQVQEQNLRDKESLNNKSKATINEMKQQLATIKDENVRKTKLLNALKAAKASDSNSLEQWKNEVKQQEDTIKRLQRTLTSKDALTKDLRNKADALEEALTIAEKGLSSETNTNDMYQLTAPELRARLKEYDLERARSKARLQALKDKISELEHEIVILKEENERLKKNTDKSDAMKASMGRKDTLIANMKAQIEKLKTELEECKHQELVSQAENEKRIKQLQRQIDGALRNQQDFERETQLMRQRLTESIASSAEEDYTQRSHNIDLSSTNRSNVGGNPSTSPNASHPPRRPKNDGTNRGPSSSNQVNTSMKQRRSMPTPSNNSSFSNSKNVHFSSSEIEDDSFAKESYSQAPASATRQSIPVPASLSSAENDIQDVMNALGVSSGRSGLPPRPPNNRYDNNTYSSMYDVEDSTIQPPIFADNNRRSNANPAVSDLLQRLQGLAQVLPPSPPSTILNQSSSSSSGSDSHNISSQSNILDISSSSASSGPSLGASMQHRGPSFSVDADPSDVEKRLQALVSAALLSPSRPTF